MKDSAHWASLPSLLRALGAGEGPLRALVVEDEARVREGLSSALTALGHEVDAREGVEVGELPLVGFDVAILDHYFLSSSLTGVTLTLELRRSCPSILILGISSDTGKNAEMVRMGATLAVVKSALRRWI